MRARIASVLAAVTLAALPALAHADLYINTKGIRVEMKPSNCSFIRTSSDGKWQVYQCSGHGDFPIYPYSNQRTGKCVLRWEGDQHWHATWVTKTADCTMHWENSNTLDLWIPFP